MLGSCRGSWCQIYNGNRVGFVSARYVRFGSYRATPMRGNPTQQLLSAIVTMMTAGCRALASGSVWAGLRAVAGGRVGAVQVGEVGQTITTVVLAAIANPIVAVGAMAGTLAGAMVHNGVAVDGRGARFAVTGAWSGCGTALHIWSGSFRWA